MTIISWVRSYMGKPNDYWFNYNEVDFSAGQQWVSIDYSEGFLSLASSFALLHEDCRMRDHYWDKL